MAVTRVSNLIDEFLAPAFDQKFVDEDVTWEWSIVMHPQLGTVIYISVWVKSVLVGQLINNGVIVPLLPELNEERAKEIVDEIGENIAQARSEALTQTAPQNGEKPSLL